MKISPYLFAANICLSLMSSLSSAQEISEAVPVDDNSSLQMVVTNIAPWGYLQDGKAQGLHVELLRDIGREWSKAYQLKVMPYARVARDIERGKADLSVLFDSPSSEEAAHRILPLPKVDVIMVMREDLTLEDLQHKQNLKVGRLRLGFYGADSLPVKAQQWVTVNSVAQGVGMLGRERLHMLVTTAPAYKYALQQLGIEQVPGVRAEYLNSVQGSVFLSRLSSVNKAEIEAATKRAMLKHWDKLKEISQLHNAANVLQESSLEIAVPVVAAR